MSGLLFEKGFWHCELRIGAGQKDGVGQQLWNEDWFLICG